MSVMSGSAANQFVSFGIGHHEPVLDPVVHHLCVVSGAHRSGVDEPIGDVTGRPQAVENGHQSGDVRIQNRPPSGHIPR